MYMITGDCETMMRVDGADQFRNIQWCSNKCVLAYGVCGVWHSKKAKEADVNSVDINSQHTLVAMGDSTGYVSVFRHPCTKPGVRLLF